MESNRTWVLSAVLVGAALIVSAVILRPSGQEIRVITGPDAAPNLISVSGLGTIDVPPDTAIATLGIQRQAKTAQEAQTAASQAMNAVLDAVRGHGIAEEKIRTSGYNLNAEYDYRQVGNPTLTSYRVYASITITVTKLDKMGPVIDSAIAAGANQVQGVQFTVKDVAAHQQAAVDKALVNARVKAEASAARLGAKLGGVRRIAVTDQPSGSVVRPMYAEATADAGTNMPIQPGEVMLKVGVQVDFMLQQ